MVSNGISLCSCHVLGFTSIFAGAELMALLIGLKEQQLKQVPTKKIKYRRPSKIGIEQALVASGRSGMPSPVHSSATSTWLHLLHDGFFIRTEVTCLHIKRKIVSLLPRFMLSHAADDFVHVHPNV